jgi:predicted acylesterase/phospholipase RssA
MNRGPDDKPPCLFRRNRVFGRPKNAERTSHSHFAARLIPRHGESLVRRIGQLAGVIAAILSMSGCVAARHYPPPNLASAVQLAPADAPRPKMIQTTANSAGPVKPRTILAISGGGVYGAYSAGVLKGWSESGTRPRFDVVTGVSTGALVAPFAFLGPEQDRQLEQLYTTMKLGDVLHRRFLPTILWSDSMADSAPLRKQIEKTVTPEILEQIAREHRAGRRLYIGTTNLDTMQPVVWDMGAIAAGNAPDKLTLFRNVMVATCSIPGLLPPVPIDIEINGVPVTELHVDGAITAPVFVPPCALSAERNAATTRSIYVVVSGKVNVETRAVPRWIVNVFGASLDGLFLTGTRSDLQRIYVQARDAGAEFRFAAVAADFNAAQNSMDINPKVMKQLFEEGRRFAVTGFPWQRIPPGMDSADEPAPRTGSKLILFDPSAANPAK